MIILLGLISFFFPVLELVLKSYIGINADLLFLRLLTADLNY